MIPYLFSKEPIGEIINPDLKQAIDYVKMVSSKKNALERAFKIIVKRYRGYRFRTYIFFWKVFETDPNKLWERAGFRKKMYNLDIV